MPRVKEERICDLCGVAFHRHNGNTKARFCSILCSCRAHHTKAFQSKAGKAGGSIKIALRGTGTKGYIKEFGRHQHRVVMEKIIGRKLRKGEVVHHEDKNKHNNVPDNLILFKNQADHARHHAKHL